MNTAIRILTTRVLILATLAAYCAHSGATAKSAPTNNPDREVIALSIDNDVFVPTTSDRDFTAGFALTHSGLSVLDRWHKLDDLVGSVDRALGVDQTRSGAKEYVPSIEIGSYGFTPDNIASGDIQSDDRPYASLVYVSSSRAYLAKSRSNAWTSSVSIGLLGLIVFEAAQNGVHDLVGSKKAEGWDHQISEGGELTFRYQAAYHRYWQTDSQASQYKTTYFGSVGYLTEAGIAISTRRGRIASPDYRFNPELIAYGERVNETLATPYAGKENYFWGGIALKARLYNVYLQGQFRHSDHTLGGSDVNILIIESWLGYTRSLGRNFKLSYVIRAHSSEIREGKGDRTMIWGGFVLSKSL